MNTNNTEKRIAIANICLPHLAPFKSKDGDVKAWSESLQRWILAPNYPECLNAMHEAEEHLSEHEQARFQDVLAFMFVGPSEHFPLFQVVHATAEQRADAFLKTKGLWTLPPSNVQKHS